MAWYDNLMPGEVGGAPVQNQGLQGLLSGSDPLFNIGLGILANNYGNYGAFGPAIGRGFQQGVQQTQQAQEFARQKQMQDFQMQQAQRQAQQQAQQEQARTGLLGALKGTPTFQGPYANPQQAVQNVQNPQAINEALIQYDPDAYIKRLTTPQEIKAYKPGDVLYQGGKQVAAIPTAPEKLNPNNPFMVIDGQIVPNKAYQQYELEKAGRGAARTNVNVNQTQEKEENKAVGKYFGEQYADIQKAGLNAGGKINRVQRLNQLLEGVNTGKFTPMGVEIASAGQSLGLNIDPKLGNKQAAEALSSEMALELRNPAGGAGMPGAMSDADRNYLKGMVPGIEKTPEGRRLISDSMVKMAKRDQEVANLARQYRKQHGTIDEGFYEQLQNFADKNPLFKAAQSATPKPSGKAKFLGFE